MAKYLIEYIISSYCKLILVIMGKRFKSLIIRLVALISINCNFSFQNNSRDHSQVMRSELF